MRTNDYIVSFRNTLGGHAGVITWTSFESKDAFDAWMNEGNASSLEVVEEGITQERAIELTRSTPIASYFRAAVEDSIDPVTGQIYPDLLRSNLSEVGFIAREILHRHP